MNTSLVYQLEDSERIAKVCRQGDFHPTTGTFRENRLREAAPNRPVWCFVRTVQSSAREHVRHLHRQLGSPKPDMLAFASAADFRSAGDDPCSLVPLAVPPNPKETFDSCAEVRGLVSPKEPFDESPFDKDALDRARARVARTLVRKNASALNQFADLT